MSTKATGFEYLRNRYFVMSETLRKHFPIVADGVIGAATVRVEGKKSINFKASVEKLNAAMIELGLNQPKAVAA